MPETFYISPELTPQELAMLPNYGSSSGSCSSCGSSSCASGCTEKKTTKFPENNPRYQWTIDDKKCTITLKVRVDLVFLNPPRDIPEPKWTAKKMDAYEKQSESKDGKCKGNKQIQSAHEFGHLLGLEHPGFDSDNTPEQNNSIEAYAADEDALMGCGMEIRNAYFEKWKDALTQKRKKCCKAFIIGTND